MKHTTMDDFASENTAIQNFGKLNWLHWLILSFSILLTFGAWYFTYTQTHEKTKLKFENEASHIVELVYERLEKYEDTLWGAVATIHSQNYDIDYNKWKSYTDNLHIEEKYPGINGLGVIYHILPEDLESYLAEQHIIRPGFKIHPKHSRQEFLPITYIEPLHLSVRAVGLDMAYEESRYDAVMKSRETGLSIMTAPITLVQKEPGFLIFVPFYKTEFNETLKDRQNNFLGLVYAPFETKYLMEGVLNSKSRQLALKIIDGDTVLYDEKKEQADEIERKPMFSKNISVEKYGRSWQFHLETKKTFREANKSSKPAVILMAGILIDSLLFGVFYLLSSLNRRSLEFSEKVLKNYQEKISELEIISNELSESKKFQNIIINTIPSFICVKDHEFRIVQANKSFLEMYPEDQREKIIGCTTVESYPPFQAEKILQADKIAFSEGYHQAEEIMQLPDGESHTLVTTKVAFDSNNQQYLLSIGHDVTLLKEAEREIMRSNAELERFAFLASHDLQEPLRMVNSFTQLLRDEYQSTFDEQARFYMDTVIDSSARMKMLVHDLLAYSQIQDSDLEYEKVDTNGCLRQCLENLSESISLSNAQITSDRLPVIHSVAARFTRVLQNIISNAIKYKHPDRDPSIHISCSENHAHWTFSISDNGIGIEIEYLNQIFVLFKRLHNNSQYSGTGIGLAICQKIVESFKGTLWAESEIGEGSVFYFSIPKVLMNDNSAAPRE